MTAVLLLVIIGWYWFSFERVSCWEEVMVLAWNFNFLLPLELAILVRDVRNPDYPALLRSFMSSVGCNLPVIGR